MKIKANKDLFNKGKCFTKGKIYDTTRQVKYNAGLMECQVINDLGEPHNIGSWWRHFKLL